MCARSPATDQQRRPGLLGAAPWGAWGVTAPSAHTAHQPCFRNRPGTPQIPFSLTYPHLLGLGHCSSGHRQEDPPHGSSQACPSCSHLGHLRCSNAWGWLPAPCPPVGEPSCGNLGVPSPTGVSGERPQVPSPSPVQRSDWPGCQDL